MSIKKATQEYNKSLDNSKEIWNNLYKEYCKKFDKDKRLQKAIKDLESSTDFTWMEDLVARWIRFSIEVEGLEEKALEEYLQDQRIYYEKEYQCLLTYDGPSIIINEEGDVLDQDSGKWIIDSSKYSTIEELYSLIEQWMDKTGYFPNVFKTDRYGNVFLVNTNKRSK